MTAILPSRRGCSNEKGDDAFQAGDRLAPYDVQQIDDGRAGTLPVGFIHATTRLLSNEQMS